MRYEEALPHYEEAAAIIERGGRALEELYWYLGDTLGGLDRYEDAEMRFSEELRAFARLGVQVRCEDAVPGGSVARAVCTG